MTHARAAGRLVTVAADGIDEPPMLFSAIEGLS